MVSEAETKFAEKCMHYQSIDDMNSDFKFLTKQVMMKGVKHNEESPDIFLNSPEDRMKKNLFLLCFC